MPDLPIKDIAEKYDRSRQFFDKLCRQKKIKSRKKKGKRYINLESVEEYFAGRPDGTTRTRTGKNEAEDSGGTNGSKRPEMSKLQKLTIELQKEKIQGQKIKNAREANQLVDFETVRKERFETGRILRDNLVRNLPKMISDRTYGKSRHEIEQISKALIMDALLSVIGGENE
jgi:hypothetical protein